MGFLAVLGSPSRVRVCCAACGAQNLQKKHVPEILEYVPDGFYCCLLFLYHFLYVFVGFGVSQQGACVLRCLRRPEPPEKTTPHFCWSMYLMCFTLLFGFFSDFRVFLSVFGYPSRLRVCCAAFGAPEPSEKTRPWNLGACTLWVSLIL